MKMLFFWKQENLGSIQFLCTLPPNKMCLKKIEMGLPLPRSFHKSDLQIESTYSVNCVSSYASLGPSSTQISLWNIFGYN